jgi:hypothetical protein
MKHYLLDAAQLYRNAHGGGKMPKKGTEDYSDFRRVFKRMKGAYGAGETIVPAPMRDGEHVKAPKKAGLHTTDALRLQALIEKPVPTIFGGHRMSHTIPADTRGMMGHTSRHMPMPSVV